MKKERKPYTRHNEVDTWIAKNAYGNEYEYQKIDGKVVTLRRVTPYQEPHKQKNCHIAGLNHNIKPPKTQIKPIEKPNPETHIKQMVKVDARTYKEVWVPKP